LNRRSRSLPSLCLVAAALHATGAAHAQAGPPFLTNDPGTPGNANWEINLAAVPSIARGAESYQIPQYDFNFGVGDRVQLTYEIPYVLQNTSGQPAQTGWSNGFPGLKWRFLDQGDDGWQMSAFPQVETGSSAASRQKGIASLGPRYLLPVEVSRKIGPLDTDFEAGYYVPGHGLRERILGFVTGRPLTPRFELYAEIYDDRAVGGPPRETILDLGGRYKLHPGIIALFMAGRSVSGSSNGQPQFMGYFGVQILLSHYGRTLNAEP
jgi:hypothetical protein